MINIKSLLGLDYYTSPLDIFLADFNENHPRLSESQRAEVKKYQRIYQCRDNPCVSDKPETMWEKF